MLAIVAALALASAHAAVPPPVKDGVETENVPRIDTAARLLVDHQPADALAVADTAIAEYEADHAGEKRRIYCGMTMQETLLYGVMAAKDKVSAVMVPPGYCTALYIRGFALVDLGRPADARATYEKLVALAPMHAHFLTELGQLARVDKDWPRMIETCQRAADAARIGDPATAKREQGAALRCQGYALVEQRRFDDAETRYREALAIDPSDAKSAGELRYIAAQRSAK